MFDDIIIIFTAVGVNEVGRPIYGEGIGIYMDFSRKLKQERQRVGITQEELAARTGLSQRSIAAYETQGVMARYKNVLKLAAALQVAADYLLNDELQEPAYKS